MFGPILTDWEIRQDDVSSRPDPVKTKRHLWAQLWKTAVPTYVGRNSRMQAVSNEF